MFLTIELVPRITDICISIYVLVCRFRLARLCDSDFGITAVDDITIGMNYYYFAVSRHRPNDTLGLSPSVLTLPFTLVYLHVVTDGAIQCVLLHPPYLFTFLQFIFKFTQKLIYIYIFHVK